MLLHASLATSPLPIAHHATLAQPIQRSTSPTMLDPVFQPVPSTTTSAAQPLLLNVFSATTQHTTAQPALQSLPVTLAWQTTTSIKTPAFPLVQQIPHCQTKELGHVIIPAANVPPALE